MRTVLFVGLRLGGLLLSFAASIAFLRLAGPEIYGAIAVLSSSAAILGGVASMGLNQGLIRAYQSSIEFHDTDRGIVSASFIATSAVATVLVCLLLLVEGVIPLGSAQERLSFALLAISTNAASLLLVVASVQARPHIHALAFAVVTPLLRIGLLWIASRTYGSLSLGLVSILYASSYAAITGTVLVVAFRHHTVSWPRLEHRQHYVDALKYSAPLLLVSVVSILSTNVFTVLLARHVDVDVVGYFAYLQKFVLAIGVIVSSLGVSVAPRLVVVTEPTGAAPDQHRVFMALERRTRLISAVAGAAVLAFIATADLSASFGNVDVPEWQVLVYLALLGQAVSASAGPVGYFLMLNGFQRRELLSQSVGVVAGVIALSILAPRIGLWGAAISYSTGLIVANVLKLICLPRTVRSRHIMTFLRSALCLVGSSGLLVVLATVVEESLLLQILLAGVIGLPTLFVILGPTEWRSLYKRAAALSTSWGLRR